MLIHSVRAVSDPTDFWGDINPSLKSSCHFTHNMGRCLRCRSAFITISSMHVVFPGISKDLVGGGSYKKIRISVREQLVFDFMSGDGAIRVPRPCSLTVWLGTRLIEGKENTE